MSISDDNQAYLKVIWEMDYQKSFSLQCRDSTILYREIVSCAACKLHVMMLLCARKALGMKYKLVNTQQDLEKIHQQD